MCSPDDGIPTRTLSRRALLSGGATGGLGLLAASCGFVDRDDGREVAPAPAPTEGGGGTDQRVVTPTATPTPEPTPRQVESAGRIERTVMTGSEWENPVVITHSGVRGERVLVLGGVHGNEPGGWLAAEEIYSWDVQAGSLIVFPRANIVATRLLERTTEEMGDLNRLYPGSLTSSLPMARMAAEIVRVAREFDATLAIDMHESWGFYVERTEEQQGTAFIGQTITGGPGPEADVATTLGAAVNEQIGVERDHLVMRDRRSFSFPGGFEQQAGLVPDFWRPGRGGSSLSLGQHVEGLTPVLVEMGQRGQPVERRAELHRLVVRTALEQRGML